MRIALIAMSGVRAYNPELTKLGLTLPGFLERGKVIASLPSLSLLTVAALTPDRHEVEYHEVADIEELGELPECDVAAVSTYSAQVGEAYELLDRYATQGTTTVIGGLHVTTCPDEAQEHADVVVIGEAEPVWPELLDDIEHGRAKPRCTSPGDFDLAAGPIPRFDLLDPSRYNRLTVQTQRGCPWHCEFCASSILLTSRYKQKPPERVADEIGAVKAIWPRPFIEFADDNTFVNKHHGRRLMEAIGDLGVRWFTETDVSVADDPALLADMKTAGCAEVLVGFESPNPSGLEGLELKRNWKLHQVDRYAEAVAAIQSHGIALNACFVLGLDGQGPDIFDAVERFVDETDPFDVQITVLTAFPGTPLYTRLLAEGRILRPGAWELCTLFDVNVRPRDMTVEQLEAGLVDLGRRIYSQENTDKRRRGFKDQWRRGMRRARQERIAS
jgi:radical SAM superfamily enzyme YgiQ (UPF0313 family)